jgi:cellulose synthase/poly-beta-1,6-N-acetylglucosamine synthase-like glycosyltransferase
MLFILIIFLAALFLIIHSYLIYPLIVLGLSKIHGKTKLKEDLQPDISILISAYNEESIIEKTIRNIFNSDYGREKIEIIIGSDKSEDGTNAILKNLSEEFNNIKFFPFEIRRGKSAVLNDLVEKSSNDILVFTDANTYIYPDAIRKLVQHYVDKNIGGVCGRLVLVDDLQNRASGYEEKSYWDLESRLKKLEGDSGILIGANGGIYSIRKSLFQPIPLTYPVMDDFYVSMKVLEQNKKMVYENDAVAEESIAPSLNAEFRRKIRNNAIMISTIKALKKLMTPAFGLTAFAFWSHKVIRWFTPILLLLILITNILLIHTSIVFQILLYIQLCFYLISFSGFIFRARSFYPKFLVMPFYFTMTNIAMFIGLVKFITGTQTSFWQSTPRK